MLQESLARLGLKDKEISIFLSLLELGPQPTSIIAKRAGVNRATAYIVLDALVSKGLVSRVEKAGIQTFAAIAPEDILEIIRSKKRELDVQETQFRDVIPQLRGMMSQYIIPPKVRYYEGIDGVKTVMDETLTSHECIRTYSSVDAWEKSPLGDYMQNYCHKRSYEAKVPLKSLTFDTPLAREHFTLPHQLLDVRFIPEEMTLEWSDIDIFDNKVVMVSLVPGNICGIVIESQELAMIQKSMFDMAWKGCERRDQRKAQKVDQHALV